MKSALGLILRVGIFAVSMLVLLYAVVQTIQRPVRDETRTYSAMFTDANGLRVGNDARLFGVRVGKVTGLELAGAQARVTFTLDRDHKMFANSTLAIRYQNLTGQRYLDVQQPADTGAERTPGEVIGTDHTTPAFDITRLFNGLQPVLAELSPADINLFATSLLAVLEGNGSGIGPAVDSLGKLLQHVKDRQLVISTLVRNLSEVADTMGGKAENTLTLVQQLIDLFTALYERLPGMVEFAYVMPPVLDPIDGLLRTLGLTSDPNPYLDTLLATAIPDPKQLLDTLNRLPAVVQALTAAVPSNTAEVSCSRGTATAPQPLQVLIAGQRIALCNR